MLAVELQKQCVARNVTIRFTFKCIGIVCKGIRAYTAVQWYLIKSKTKGKNVLPS